MKNLFNDLIDSGAWTLLRGQTEKLIVAWFATKYPDKPLQALREESLLNIVKSIGASKQKIVKESIETILRTSTFLSCYETHQLAISVQVNGKDSGNVSRKDSRNVSSPKKEKGKEEERKFSPQTPFIKKEGEKGKEKGTSSSASSSSSGAKRTSSVDPLLRDDFKAVMQQINESCVPGTDGIVTSGSAKKATIEEVTLKYPNEFEVFYLAYPNRWGLEGVGYLRLKGQWFLAEKKGWTGPAILDALKKADAVWQVEKQNADKKVFIPDADKFLSEEIYLRRYIPALDVAKMLGSSKVNATLTDSITLANPAAFAEFCELYPKKRGLLTPEERIVAEKAWKGCEERGWHAYDIIRALKDALVSQSWTEKDGRYIPSAEKFLNEEQMRQFLPIGFKTNGGSTLAKQPISAEKAFFLNPENFI